MRPIRMEGAPSGNFCSTCELLIFLWKKWFSDVPLHNKTLISQFRNELSCIKEILSRFTFHIKLNIYSSHHTVNINNKCITYCHVSPDMDLYTCQTLRSTLVCITATACSTVNLDIPRSLRVLSPSLVCKVSRLSIRDPAEVFSSRTQSWKW